MFADASSFWVTASLPAGGPSAKGLGPGADIAGQGCASALGPRRLAHPEQRTGLATWRRHLVGLRRCLASY